jgi:hypothetical protein
MATLDQIHNADHRSLAARLVPADILGRLSAAELRYRSAHAHHVIERARQTLVRESADALAAHAKKIMQSEPACDFLLEQKRRKDLLSKAPSHLWPIYQAAYREP